jgi:hypothetical protein
METNRATPRRPALPRIGAGHLTLAAWATGAVLAVVVSSMDNCSPGYPFHMLNAVLLAACSLQVAGLIAACVKRRKRIPGSGKVLAGIVIATLLALPAAGFVYLVINLDLCLDGLLF